MSFFILPYITVSYILVQILYGIYNSIAYVLN